MVSTDSVDKLAYRYASNTLTEQDIRDLCEAQARADRVHRVATWTARLQMQGVANDLRRRHGR